MSDQSSTSILFLSANPFDKDQLQLGREAQEIREGLGSVDISSKPDENGGKSNKSQIVFCPFVEP